LLERQRPIQIIAKLPLPTLFALVACVIINEVLLRDKDASVLADLLDSAVIYQVRDV
jgi:hypothetical protein